MGNSLSTGREGRDVKSRKEQGSYHDKPGKKSPGAHEEPWRTKLRGLLPHLVQNIDQLPSLLDQVESRGVLASEAVFFIREKTHHAEKVRILIEKVLKRSRAHWHDFKECLKETNNGHLISDLEESYEEAQTAQRSTTTVNTYGAMSQAKGGRTFSNERKQKTTDVTPDNRIHSAPEIYHKDPAVQYDQRSKKMSVDIPPSYGSDRTLILIGRSPEQTPEWKGSPAAAAAAAAYSISPVDSRSPGTDSGFDVFPLDTDEGDIAMLQKDLKRRYGKEHERIMLLPWRQDRVMPIGQINRNFEMRMPNDEYKDVTIDEIFEVAGEKHDRFLLEAPAGYGKTSFMKKLAYMWATDDEHLVHFDFLFLISTDEFIDFKKKSEDVHLCDYITSSNFFTKQSLKRRPSQTILYHLEHNKEKVLFIIDTNYKKALPDDVIETFLRNNMAESTVILTCRTNQVPDKILDNFNCFTSLRMTKHHPDTIQKHVNDYFQWKDKEEIGKQLLRNLGISENTVGQEGRITWLTNPMALVIVSVLWEDLCANPEAAQEKAIFTLDNPSIYHDVMKNIFRKYDCHEKGMSARVDQETDFELSKHDEEIHVLGQFAWQLIVDRQSSFPAAKLQETEFCDVLTNVGLLEPYTRLKGGFQYKEYRFVDDIWKFFLAARYLRREQDEGMIDDEGVNDAVRKVMELPGAGNISELFPKFIELQPISKY